MEKRLKQVLNGSADNYVLPFFWQTGDSHEKLREEIDKIDNCGIKAMCLESRTHEQFCEEKWFDDFGFILNEAKQRGMKVWLLDDRHFPTGFANGKIASEHPELRQWHIVESHVDVMGPCSGALLINSADENPAEHERTLIAALAVKRVQHEEILTDDVIDITGCVRGDFLYWDVPEGCYRIFFLYRTREGSLHENYIDMLSADSVDVLINEVYEPHYRRYGNEFGKTFAGFFSDEPCFANGMWGGQNPKFYDYSIGTPHMAYPWRDDFIEKISARLGFDAVKYLPALWYEMGDKTASVRLSYMDLITTAYRDCFCRRIGDWCRERGVQYIGHIIEDMNCHAHLGPGAGHYFRALDGQDMAGIDVVLQQIIPGMSRFGHTCVASSSFADPQFFDYVLAKQAASLAHLNPRMKGRAMCEMYGAYGWAEGTPVMKWLTDHMLVRGINYFVPHAFTTRYPNPDCPPHFYARGHYNQYRDFGKLMNYTNRVSHLLTDGVHIASAALLYHAEAEWCGGKYMKTQVPAELLYNAHIDYDIIPSDYIIDAAGVKNNALTLNGEEFKCLIIPFSEYLPLKLIEKLIELKKQGLRIIFTEDLPRAAAEGSLPGNFGTADFETVKTELLVKEMIESGYSDITVSGAFPLLRHYHYRRSGCDYFMFFNEDTRFADTEVLLPCRGSYAELDLLSETALAKETADGKVIISLEAGQSVILAFNEDIGGLEKQKPRVRCGELMLDGNYRISGRRMCADYSEFELETNLFDITSPEKYPDFSGIIRYETEFILPDAAEYMLDLGEVGETVTVYINGETAAQLISPPYRVNITGLVRQGKNTFTAEVANSMVYSERDAFSKGMFVGRSGLLGPVKIVYFK